MFKKKFAVSLTVLLMLGAFVTGCDERVNKWLTNEPDQKPKTVAEAVKKLEDEGKYPKLDRTDSLLGTDEDKNGVRDDIDVYIDSLPDTPQQKGALRQTSASLNYAISLDVNDPNQIAKRHYLSSRASNCLFDVYDPDSNEIDLRFKEMQAFTLNTKTRVEAYLKYNHAISGTNWKSTEDSCDEKFVK